MYPSLLTGSLNTNRPANARPAAVYRDEKDAEKKAWAYVDRVIKFVGSAELGHSTFVPANQLNLTLSDLLDEVIAHTEAKAARDGRKVADHALYSGVNMAKEWFGRVKPTDLTGPLWDKWLVQVPALKKRYKAATINRTLAYVRRALRLALANRRIAAMPSDISSVMLKKEEAKTARKVFFTWSEFQALLRATKDVGLKDYYWYGYLTGWRSRSIKKLQWSSDVDMKARTILLQAEDQKTGERVFLSMDPELYSVMQRRWKRRTYETKDGVTAISRFVFHRDGQTIGDIRKSWAAGCAKAGLLKLKRDRQGNVVTQVVDGKEDVVMVPSKLFHDIPEQKAMAMNARMKMVKVAKGRRWNAKRA
jgi:integrase